MGRPCKDCGNTDYDEWYATTCHILMSCKENAEYAKELEELKALKLQMGETDKRFKMLMEAHERTLVFERQLIDERNAANRLNVSLQNALLNISQVLGTGACKANKCEGCQFEMEEAAGIARENLAVKKNDERFQRCECGHSNHGVGIDGVCPQVGCECKAFVLKPVGLARICTCTGHGHTDECELAHKPIQEVIKELHGNAQCDQPQCSCHFPPWTDLTKPEKREVSSPKKGKFPNKAVNGCKCPCHAEIAEDGSGWPCGVDECAPCHVEPHR
jgi:hypothetical protein